MVKKLYWDLSWRQGRYEYVHWMLRDIPGHFGVSVRRFFLKRFFPTPGRNMQIYPGLYIRGIHGLHLGDNVWLGQNAIINANGGVTLGNDVLIGPSVKIWSVNHNYDDLAVSIAEQGYVDKPVVIGDRVWLGAGSIILPGVELGEGIIVTAGSVVNAKKYPPNIMLAGNPARKIGTRKGM